MAIALHHGDQYHGEMAGELTGVRRANRPPRGPRAAFAAPFLPLAALGGCLLVALAGCAPVQPAPDPGSLPSSSLAAPSAAHRQTVEEGRSLARSLAAEERLPGLSLAVAVDGEIVWAEGLGWADLQARTPVTPSTQFRIGAISQTLTAAAAGLLVQRGRLDLDAPVQRYLPAFPGKEWPITLRQLMSHTAGIRDHRGEGELFRKQGCAGDAERLALFADSALRFQPGSEAAYSTYGWVLVGAALAAAAHEPYEAFLQREILEPAGLTRTVPDSPGPGVQGRARFYYPRFMLDTSRGLHDAPEVDLSCILPAGGFLSTPADLVRFASAIMDGTLLGQALVRELHTPVQLTTGQPTGRGLGWEVRQQPLDAGGPSITVAGQGLGDPVRRAFLSATTVGGHAPGATATLLTIPGRRLAVAVATNTSGARGVPELAARLAELFARPSSSPRASSCLRVRPGSAPSAPGHPQPPGAGASRGA